MVFIARSFLGMLVYYLLIENLMKQSPITLNIPEISEKVANLILNGIRTK